MATTTSNTAARKAAQTRKTQAVKRSTSAKKAAATRRQSSAAKQAAQTRREFKTPVVRAGEIVERTVLVPVGAALIARDGALATIDELRSRYSTRRKAENELRRFERRGVRAVKRLEREVKNSRTRFERELKRRSAQVERKLRSTARDIESGSEPVTRNVEYVTARVENVAQDGRDAAAKVSERIAALT
jgi:hypothetical protein